MRHVYIRGILTLIWLAGDFQRGIRLAGVGRALCSDGGGLRVFRLRLLEKGEEQ